MHGDDGAVTPVLAVVMAVLVTAALGATAFVVVQGFGKDEDFTAAAMKADAQPGELRLAFQAGRPVDLDRGYLLVSIDGASEVEVPLSDLAPQIDGGRTWHAGDDVCIIGSDPACLYADGALVNVRLVVDDQLIWETQKAIPAQPGGDGGGGGSGDEENDEGDESDEENEAPMASFTFSVDGATVLFDGAASSDPDEDSLSYAWDYGDDNSGTGASASHLYLTPGTYTARLTVSDGNGGSHNVQETVVVYGSACFAYEDADGDRAFTSGTDTALVNGELDDAHHISGVGLVLPACLGHIEYAGNVHFTADDDLVLEVDVTSTGGDLDIHSKFGSIEADGVTLWAQKKVDIDAQGSLSVMASTITADKDHLFLDAGGALSADDATLSAKKSIRLDGCPVSTLGTSFLQGAQVIDSC